MPRRCCVPGCKSNYDTSIKTEGLVTAFSFPSSEELRKAWLRAIPRKDWAPTKHSVVCRKHFAESDVISVDIYKDSAGSVCEMPMKRAKLEPGAVPSLFHGEGIPAYLSKTPKPVARTNPDERRKAAVFRNESAINDFLQSDVIGSDFEEFLKQFPIKLNAYFDKWNYKIISGKLYLYVFNDEELSEVNSELKIISCVTVDTDFSIQVCVNSSNLTQHDLTWLFSNRDIKLTLWSQIDNILARYKGEPVENSTPLMISCLQNAHKYLSLAVKYMTDDYAYEENLHLLCDQINLLLKEKCRRYSKSTVIFAFVIFSLSTTVYNMLQNYIILPSKRHLQQISASLHVSPDNLKHNDHYLLNLAKSLSEREKVVCLLVDEIYVKSKLEYKAKKVLGFAENQENELAKTVQCFMITSCFGNVREIVHICPVNGMTGQELAPLVLGVIRFVQQFGFIVLCVITDNNRTNQNMFRSIADRDCHNGLYFTNPSFSDKTIFLLYDNVHILKNIRNNWLNLKHNNMSFTFPDLNDDTEHIASFQHLRDMHKNEGQSIIKKAYKLNNKSVYPNNLERQNVKLVLNIFHESTVAALKCHNAYLDTALFLQIIIYWWDIMNVKSTIKGKLLRKTLASPIQPPIDSNESVIFLQSFYKWLLKWNLNTYLSKDTYGALMNNIINFLNLIPYCFTNFDIKYLLLGKFQTDMLEYRFGKYRQLSGTNYSVSLTQIMESEKKIRIRHILKKYNNYDEMKCNDDITDEDCSNHLESFQRIFTSNYLQTLELDTSAQLYVCGYASHAVNKKIKCVNCEKILVKTADEPIDDTYFNSLQRGGLKVPCEELTYLCFHLFAIFEYIVNDRELKKKFFSLPDQRTVLKLLTFQSLTSGAFAVDLNIVCDLCNTSSGNVYKMASNVIANIVLNNYTKNVNDLTNNSSCKRKLSTLTFNN